MFDSVDEQLEYLEDFDLDVSRAALLEGMGRYEEAADIHLTEGRTLEAIRLLLKDETSQTAVRRGRLCILQGLWEIASFGAKISGHLEEAQRLLDLASSVKTTGEVDSVVVDEVCYRQTLLFHSLDIYWTQLSMFQSIKSGNTQTLRLLGKKFEAQGNLAASVLCFDHAFKFPPNMFNMTSTEISAFLSDFLLFCRLLYRVAETPNPCQDLRFQKLFCFHPSSENHFLLPNGTFLQETLLESRSALAGSNEQGILVSEWELSRRFREHLRFRLMHRIKVENEACKQAKVLSPCLPFLINNGHCNRKDCPHEHLPAASLTSNWFTQIVRIHLQQILIIQGLLKVSILPSEKVKQFR